MAACVKCARKLGFFSANLCVGFVTPLCKACHGPLMESITDFVLKYDELEKTAKSDPRAAAWKAVANLVCAEQVNEVLETHYGIDQIGVKEETWTVSRDKAVGYAQMALGQVAEGSAESRFLSAILTRAKAIEAGQGKQHTKVRRVASLGLFGGGGTVFTADLEALMSGLVGFDSFDATLKTLPGHEWLTPGASPATPPLEPQTTVERIHLQCPKCSRRMTVGKEHAGKRGKCPGCGTGISVPSPSESKEEKTEGKSTPPVARAGSGSVDGSTDASFQQQVVASTAPVLVFFWAPWCGPCRTVKSAVEQLAKEFAGRVKFVSVNTDDNPKTAGRYGVDSIPSVILFKDGKVIRRLVGEKPMRRLKEFLDGI